MQDERRTKSVVTNLGDDSDGAPRQAGAGRSSSSRACGVPVQAKRRTKSVVTNLGEGSDGVPRRQKQGEVHRVELVVLQCRTTAGCSICLQAFVMPPEVKVRTHEVKVPPI